MNESRITPKGIIDDAIGMIGKMQESAFPLDVFPVQIRTIILKMHEYLNFPIDYTACSMLCAIATGIGNTHILRFKKGWYVKYIMYMALVGRPGSNKSHPLKAAFKPFFDFDREQFQKFAGELRNYERIMNLSRKERTAQGYDICPAPPIRTRFLVSDITQEAMAKAISENPRGICLFMDELQGWINNFTRYNKGSEEQFYISLFNGSNYMSDRKGSMNNIHIDNPFSNIIGTIQPEILADTFKGSKSNNGFTDRILFAIPQMQDKPYWAEDDMDTAYYNEWDRIISKLIRMEMSKDESNHAVPIILEYEPEARNRIMEWQHRWADMSNAEESDRKRSIYSKFETYIHRFCLAIQLGKWLCDEAPKDRIDIDTVDKVVKLVEYFKDTALQVLSMIQSELAPRQQELLDLLPEQFTRAEGLKIAEQLELSASTYDRFLKALSKNGYLGHKHGNYKKRDDKMTK